MVEVFIMKCFKCSSTEENAGLPDVCSVCSSESQCAVTSNGPSKPQSNAVEDRDEDEDEQDYFEDVADSIAATKRRLNSYIVNTKKDYTFSMLMSKIVDYGIPNHNADFAKAESLCSTTLKGIARILDQVKSFKYDIRANDDVFRWFESRTNKDGMLKAYFMINIRITSEKLFNMFHSSKNHQTSRLTNRHWMKIFKQLEAIKGLTVISCNWFDIVRQRVIHIITQKSITATKSAPEHSQFDILENTTFFEKRLVKVAYKDE